MQNPSDPKLRLFQLNQLFRPLKGIKVKVLLYFVKLKLFQFQFSGKFQQLIN